MAKNCFSFTVKLPVYIFVKVVVWGETAREPFGRCGLCCPGLVEWYQVLTAVVTAAGDILF